MPLKVKKCAFLFQRRKHMREKLRKRVSASSSKCVSRSCFERMQRQQRLGFIFIMSLAFNCFITTCKDKRQKMFWCKERSKQFWERTVRHVFKETDWIENFRLRKATFDYLCEKLRHYITRAHTNMRSPISVEERVAVTLWYLSTGSGFRTVAWLFGISKASVSLIVRETCDAIVYVLRDKLVKFPKGEMLNQVIDGFEDRWGFPQCAGAIDGSHIPITPPSNSRTDFFNRKGFYSIILQAVVDYKYMFTDICVGWPGKVHDARVFRNSNLFEKGSNKTLFPDRTRNIDGVDVPVVILGDPAYPLLEWLMKPFIDNGRLNDGQKLFNYRQSRARMVVENAFGRLKGRWRVLLKRMEVGVNVAPVIICACCVLHNLCELWGEVFQDQWLDGVDENNGQLRVNNGQAMGLNNAKRIRNAIVSYFQANN